MKVRQLERIFITGKSCTTEWAPEYFKQILGFFINGVEEGLKENEKYYKDADI